MIICSYCGEDVGHEIDCPEAIIEDLQDEIENLQDEIENFQAENERLQSVYTSVEQWTINTQYREAAAEVLHLLRRDIVPMREVQDD